MRNPVGRELDALLAENDPRTIPEIKADDSWQEGTITEATEHDGGWSLSWTETRERRADGEIVDEPAGLTMGCGIAADRNPNGVVLEVGQTIRVYGRGFGFEFHGMDIDGREVFWRTPLERVADRVAWLAQHDRDQRERFIAGQAKLDADYERLSAPLKARIDRFRAESPDFRIRSEAYELFACVEADKIVAHLRPRIEAGEDAEAVVKEFYDLPWERQKADAGIDDGHSGNTFGGACSMARALLTGSPV